MSTPSTTLGSTPSTSGSTVIPSSNCANTYICPGGGTGYGIQFNITNADIDTLIIPSTGLSIAAAASADYNNGSNTTSTYSSSPITWWWKNIVQKFPGLAGPTPMLCIQKGQNGFAVGLAQTIVAAFGVSPSRICNAQMYPVLASNDVDISVVKYVFYINDINPRTLPMANDYLPSACLGAWIVSWLVRSTNVTFPNNAVVPPPSSIPDKFRSESCPVLDGAPAPTLYFTNNVNVDKDSPIFIEKLKDSFRNSFNNNSILAGIFIPKNVEHATNLVGISVGLNGINTNIFAQPQTVLDYFGMYAYPLSFIGAILFTVVQIMDINLNTAVANKNLSMVINLSFIVWSIIGMTTYYNLPVSSVPFIGQIFTYNLKYVLPFNTQSVVTQL